MSGSSDLDLARAERALEAGAEEMRVHCCPRCVALRALAELGDPTAISAAIALGDREPATQALAAALAAVTIVGRTPFGFCAEHRAAAVDASSADAAGITARALGLVTRKERDHG